MNLFFPEKILRILDTLQYPHTNKALLNKFSLSPSETRNNLKVKNK